MNVAGRSEEVDHMHICWSRGVEDFETRFSNVNHAAATKGPRRLEMQLSSLLPPVWHASKAMGTLYSTGVAKRILVAHQAICSCQT